jgi:hypothetical protein
MKLGLVAVLAVALAGLAGCDRSKSTLPTAPTAPPVTPPTPPPSAPILSRVSVTGKTSFTSVGDTAQLTAIAAMSNGTTQDVTGEASWKSSDPSVFSVSPTGLVTVVRFGLVFVSATYQSKIAGLSIQATPAGSFIVSGRLREPGAGGIAGATVHESGSGITVSTDEFGEYSLGGLTTAHLSFDKDGYERVMLEGDPLKPGDVPMQRIVRLAAGDAGAKLTLAPHDMDFLPIVGGVRCYPCRLVRVSVPQSGVLQLRLAWAETRSILSLWVGGQLFEGAGVGPSSVTADVMVTAGEFVVYVGTTKSVDQYVPLTLAAALVK